MGQETNIARKQSELEVKILLCFQQKIFSFVKEKFLFLISIFELLIKITLLVSQSGKRFFMLEYLILLSEL